LLIGATVEALAEKLIENPRGLLVVRDELPGWLAGLDREDAAELRAFLMTGWNGKDGWTFDRIGRGHRRVPAVCLGVIGGAQPGPLGEYLRAAMRGGASDDGMLARFGLLVWPETGGKWKNVDRYPDGPAKAAGSMALSRPCRTMPTMQLTWQYRPSRRFPVHFRAWKTPWSRSLKPASSTSRQWPTASSAT
jgi:hypothetical protein